MTGSQEPRILNNDDVVIEVLCGEGGDVAVFRHLKIDYSYQCPLDEMVRGRLVFVWEIMRSITLDPDLATRLSPQAANLVNQVRALDSGGLIEWAATHDQDRIMVAIIELSRRCEPLPLATLYSNSFAMGAPVIRDYLLRSG